MVGLFVGLLVALAVYSSFRFVDAQRRAQVSGIGALETGIGGLFAIQHDVKASGIGVVLNGQTVCPTMNIYKGGTVANGTAIAPVVITAGGEDEDSDSITIAYSGSVLANNGIPLIAGMPAATSVLKTANVRGIAVNDFLVVANPADNLPCTLMQATGTSASGFGYDIAHATTSTWNPSSPGAAFANAPAYPAGSLVYNIGQITFNWVTYRVTGGNLEAVNLITNEVDVVANNVALLKAWYGTSNGTTSQIEQWVPATDAWANPLDAAHVTTIRAIRIAAVARSQHPEKPSVVGGECDVTTVAPTSWPGGPALDLSGNSNWRCYRYRVLTLVIPLKNVIFGVSGS
jgi:type IV pilus assembly protein PilW